MVALNDTTAAVSVAFNNSRPIAQEVEDLE
jgi:hypothetical protein